MSQLQALLSASLPNAALIAGLGVASITDLRSRRIPNWLTLGVALLGLLVNAAIYGLDGVWLSLGGWGLGVALLLIPFLMRGIGAGDVKLLAAIGALKGPAFVLASAICGAIIGGLIAFVLLARHRRLSATLQDLAFFRPLPTLDHPTHSIGFAYGAAIAGGALIALGLGGI